MCELKSLCRCGWIVGLLFASLLAYDASAQSDTVAQAAGEIENPAILQFQVHGEEDELLPARLTFIGTQGAGAKLFPNADAAPNDLAVRNNVVYTRTGHGRITVPPGQYTVYVSRGPEWSIHKQDVELTAGNETRLIAKIRREIDTTGWICGDFHLHTLTHSGHGDANMKERVITFVGEGLEFAVATDHNHNTDYQPTMREIGLTGAFAAVTGNEVTVPIGHFNAFPLEPDRPVPPKDATDANPLFKYIRAEPNRFNVVPVIQLNHPRWSGLDYFGKSGLDPVTGVGTRSSYSDNFDTLEVFNENAGWGYYDAETEKAVNTSSSRHSVLQDWFNLLNRGHLYGAVGNSDSHTVYADHPGYPRNYVMSSTDDPGKIDVAEIAGALRSKQMFTTLGPFVTYEVNGHGMGSTFDAADGQIELHVRVQAASWVDCDRVKVVVNGDVIDQLDVPDKRTPVRLDKTVELTLARDSWLTLLVEGDDPLAPVLHDTDRPIRPIAVANPVWINVDGGAWKSLLHQARALVAADSKLQHWEKLESRLPSERGLVVLAAAEASHAAAASLAEHGLNDAARGVRLMAARAAETLATADLAPALSSAYQRADDDPYLRVALLRALSTCDARQFESHVFAFIEEHGANIAQRYGDELFERLPATIVSDWEVVGYFPNPERDTLKKTPYAPETVPDARDFQVKGDQRAAWTPRKSKGDGFLELRKIGSDDARGGDSIAYARSYLYSPKDQTVRFAMGTDDGGRAWINDELVYEDYGRHAANPYQQLGEVKLHQGWNRLLIKVENGNGDFGLYFRVFNNSIRAAAQPAD